MAAQETPPRDARVEGIVVGPDGRPVPDASVQVVATDTGLTGGVVALFTLGFACLLPEACFADSDQVATTATDADGRYGATLPGAYVAGTETDTDWLVTASREPVDGQLAGASSTFELEVNTARQDAPPLPLWDVPVTATTAAWQATFDAPPPPQGLRDPQLTFATAGGESVRLPGRSGTLDLRRLEPERGADLDAGSHWVVVAATAYADVTVQHAEGRTIYHQRVSTPAPDVGVIAAQLVPPSRGAACTLAFADGPGDPVDGCPVTDGSFFVTAGDPVDGQRVLTSVTVELGAMSEVADVFVRGCDAGCVVEASGDGASWARLVNDAAASRFGPAHGEELLLVASLRPALPARFVRVSRSGLAASEVSVWPSVPFAPLPPAVPVAGDGGEPAASIDVTGGPRGDGGGDVPLGLVVAATAALAVVGSAAVSAGRRR